MAWVLSKYPQITPAGYGELTPRFVYEVLLHPRDENGEILLPVEEIPDEPPTLGSELAILEMLKGYARGGNIRGDFAAAAEKLKAKYREKASGDTGNADAQPECP